MRYGWPGEDAGRSFMITRSIIIVILILQILGQGYIDVFEDGLSGDPSDAVGGLDQVVAGTAGLFAAESVGEDHRLSELTGAHQETCAVYGPLIF
jgi:hypothetical protein